jgi:hypothetical protein
VGKQSPAGACYEDGEGPAQALLAAGKRNEALHSLMIIKAVDRVQDHVQFLCHAGLINLGKLECEGVAALAKEIAGLLKILLRARA